MKLNKKSKRIIFLFGAFLLLLLIIFSMLSACNKSDGAKFKKEYESYNNKDAGNKNKYQKLKIPNNNKVKYLSKSEVIDILKNKTGLIYFGFPNCPWCRGIVPTLLKQTKKFNIELYYYNIYDDRDIYEVKDNKLELTKGSSTEYKEMLKLLESYLDDYIVIDEDGFEYEVGEKRIYAPLVIAVKDGYIKEVHQGSVELEENQSPFDKLNDKQLQELEIIFSNMIDTLNVNE